MVSTYLSTYCNGLVSSGWQIHKNPPYKVTFQAISFGQQNSTFSSASFMYSQFGFDVRHAL